MRLSFSTCKSRHPELPKEAGQRDHLVEGERREGMGGLSIAASWECYEHLGCKVSGMLAWDVRYVVMCKGCLLSPVPTCAPARTEDKEEPSQPPPPHPARNGRKGASNEVSPISTPRERQKMGKSRKVVL
jgi:hypothetical protein